MCPCDPRPPAGRVVGRGNGRSRPGRRRRRTKQRPRRPQRDRRPPPAPRQLGYHGRPEEHQRRQAEQRQADRISTAAPSQPESAPEKPHHAQQEHPPHVVGHPEDHRRDCSGDGDPQTQGEQCGADSGPQPVSLNHFTKGATLRIALMLRFGVAVGKHATMR
jgi:hypothetical protein